MLGNCIAELIKVGPVPFLVSFGFVACGVMTVFALEDIYTLYIGPQPFGPTFKCECVLEQINLCHRSVKYIVQYAACCHVCEESIVSKTKRTKENCAAEYQLCRQKNYFEQHYEDCLQCIAATARYRSTTHPPFVTTTKTTTTPKSVVPQLPDCMSHCLNMTDSTNASCHTKCYKLYGDEVGPDPDTGKIPHDGPFDIPLKVEICYLLALHSLQSISYFTIAVVVLISAIVYKRGEKPKWYPRVLKIWFGFGIFILSFLYLLCGAFLLPTKSGLYFLEGLMAHTFLLLLGFWELEDYNRKNMASTPSGSASNLTDKKENKKKEPGSSTNI
uniref:DNA translocase FtsK n=1 Tax=Lygus hesperus TaxID=30085 RepID=A0A0A9XP20_LYGHE